jgi:hypothetical protein
VVVVVVVVVAGVRRVAVARLGPRSLVFKLGLAALRVVLVVRGATVVWCRRRPIGMLMVYVVVFDRCSVLRWEGDWNSGETIVVDIFKLSN